MVSMTIVLCGSNEISDNMITRISKLSTKPGLSESDLVSGKMKEGVINTTVVQSRLYIRHIKSMNNKIQYIYLPTTDNTCIGAIHDMCDMSTRIYNNCVQ